ncbi:MAG: hypothetical protein ACOZF0_04210 [Thermodesulfobacteriota bacterium]
MIRNNLSCNQSDSRFQPKEDRRKTAAGAAGASGSTSGSAPHGQVRLRPMPFPYSAALSICSDIDDCDRRTFLELHRFINHPGDGLGLPVADSFFAVGQTPGQLAYFLPDGRSPGPDAALIIEAVRAGLIDSLHSWGDFNHNPPNPAALRDSAQRLTDMFARNGLSLKTWINHGDPNNRQNLKARLQPGYAGDNPASPFFTLDLIRVLGIQYYWWSELVDWPLSGRRPPKTMRVAIQPHINLMKNLMKNIVGRRRLTRTTAQINELCQPARLTDGTLLMAFTRHLRRFKEPSTRHTLRYALASRVLDELMAEQGYLILYTHLGMPRFADGALLPEADLAALRHLADLHRRGKIWVAPTTQLLDYWMVTKYLDWQAFREEDRLVVELGPIRDPVTGTRNLDRSETAGLCFDVPAGQEVFFRIAGQDLAPRVFEDDRSGLRVVGFDPPAPPETDFLRQF